MPFDVVGAGGLFDEPGPGEREMRQPLDGLVHVPHLVGVDHQLAIGAEHLARDAEPPDVVLQVAADLELDVREARIDRLLREPAQLGIVVAQPAGRGRVARVAVGFEIGQPLGLAHGTLAQQRERLIARDAVGDVAEVDQPHQLLGAHVGDEPPHRLALGLGPQVPHGIHHRGGRQVDRPLVRPDPAQLAVASDVVPEAAHVLGDPAQVEADHQMLQRADGGAADLVAAADGERQAVPFEPGLVGVEDDVGRRVVGVRVHRVGAVEMRRGREAHVHDAQGANGGHGRRLQSYSTAAIFGSAMLVLSYQ